KRTRSGGLRSTPISARAPLSAVIAIAWPRGSSNSVAKWKHDAMLSVAWPSGNRIQSSSPRKQAANQNQKPRPGGPDHDTAVAIVARTIAPKTSRRMRGADRFIAPSSLRLAAPDPRSRALRAGSPALVVSREVFPSTDSGRTLPTRLGIDDAPQREVRQPAGHGHRRRAAESAGQLRPRARLFVVRDEDPVVRVRRVAARAVDGQLHRLIERLDLRQDVERALQATGVGNRDENRRRALERAGRDVDREAPDRDVTAE